jgi:hypothetical protein
MYKPLIAVAIMLVLMTLSVYLIAITPERYVDKHRCVDNSHRMCDGSCPCDGMGCNESNN